MKPTPAILAALGLSCLTSCAARADEPAKGVKRIPAVFSGGHETDPADRGRPVVLVAGGLGVKPEVFREAFKQVRPAPAGTRPTRERERANKAVLLKALGPYGVTNERLDEVSDHYRYIPGRGELWTARPAVAFALVRDGKVVGFEIEDAGAGYSSKPKATVPGFPAEGVEVELAFGKDLEANGSIKAVRLPKAATK
ncbi:hypothetical protein [Paludisphaera soli]|uniref:hypothetical protein n=1 Tax=Paludisphaera soli TaxID=2712865 RepID=UPI0013EC0D4B|nr:hypothetical protein [Paludisphaera soli]